MNEYTEIEQFDTSVLERTTEDIAEFFSDAEQEAVNKAARLTYLMDKVEESGFHGTSEGSENPLMLEIEDLANFLNWFYPDLLDPRFN